MEADISTNMDQNKDEVFIKDLLVRGIIGVTESERAQPQDILVNVIIFTNVTKASNTNNVEDSVNYRTIAKKIIAHIEKTQRHTVEALAGDIADLCLAEPNAVRVSVQVEKPGAVRFSKTVGVRIERQRS